MGQWVIKKTEILHIKTDLFTATNFVRGFEKSVFISKKESWFMARSVSILIAHYKNYIIHQAIEARRQQRDLLVFESNCHLPSCLPHTMEASHCPF